MIVGLRNIEKRSQEAGRTTKIRLRNAHKILIYKHRINLLKMKVLQSMDISASAEKVWDVLSGEYGTFSKWCVGAAESETVVAVLGAKAKDGSSARKLIRPDGVVVVETLEEYSDSEMKFQYKVEGGLPGFILEAHTEWTVEKKSNDECSIIVNFHGTMNTFPGLIMDPLFSHLLLPGIFKGVCASCKHYVETGEPSDAKKKETEKYKRSKK